MDFFPSDEQELLHDLLAIHYPLTTIHKIGDPVRKTAFVLVITLLLTAVAVAADTYQTGKIVKWDNGTYPDKKKTKSWIVYQVQGGDLLYSIARHKETKAQMQ